jgi:putative ABC transport system substrate-binding protein
VAVLWNPDNPFWTHALKRLHEVAPALGVKLQLLAVRESGDLEAAFAAATREKASALLVFREATFVADRQRIVDFAATHRLPAIYGLHSFIEVGGLVVYAANFSLTCSGALPATWIRFSKVPSPPTSPSSNPRSSSWSST